MPAGVSQPPVFPPPRGAPAGSRRTRRHFAPPRPLAARLGLFIARAVAAIVRWVLRILRDATREVWRPVRRGIVKSVVLAIGALLGLGVLQAMREEPKLMEPMLAIGILVLALRFVLRLVRDSFRF